MFEHPKFGVAIDRFRKQNGFPSSVAFCYSAQVAVRSCDQSEVWKILIRYGWLPCLL